MATSANLGCCRQFLCRLVAPLRRQVVELGDLLTPVGKWIGNAHDLQLVGTLLRVRGVDQGAVPGTHNDGLHRFGHGPPEADPGGPGLPVCQLELEQPGGVAAHHHLPFDFGDVVLQHRLVPRSDHVRTLEGCVGAEADAVRTKLVDGAKH